MRPAPCLLQTGSGLKLRRCCSGEPATRRGASCQLARQLHAHRSWPEARSAWVDRSLDSALGSCAGLLELSALSGRFADHCERRWHREQSADGRQPGHTRTHAPTRRTHTHAATPTPPRPPPLVVVNVVMVSRLLVVGVGVLCLVLTVLLATEVDAQECQTFQSLNAPVAASRHTLRARERETNGRGEATAAAIAAAAAALD